MYRHYISITIVVFLAAAFGLQGHFPLVSLAAKASVPAASSAQSQHGGLPAGTDSMMDSSAPTSAEPLPDLPPGLDNKLDQWIGALGAQQPFSAWPAAKRDVYPLGPGTHGWIVLLTGEDGKSIGYLLVSATKNGQYTLTEYGAGGKPLYSLETLYQSMIQRELIDPHTSYSDFAHSDVIHTERLYLGPLKAFWKVTIRSDELYFDAKSGELLPNLSAEASAAPADEAVAPAGDMSAVTAAYSREPFDPFDTDGWVKPAAAAPELQTKKALLQALGQSRDVVYTARLFGNKLIYPFAVSGYQQWNQGSTFIWLDHEGMRALPLQALTASGTFSN